MEGEGSKLAKEIKVQSTIFVKEMTILLNFMYKERGMIDIFNHYNKESIAGHIHIDVERETVEMQIKDVRKDI